MASLLEFQSQENPVSVQAEMNILGAMTLENSAVLEALSHLTVDDFALDSHRRIFSAMIRLVNRETPVDIITLSEELRSSRELERISGTAYLASLSEGLPRKFAIEPYLGIVKTKSIARRGIAEAQEAIQRYSDPSENPQTVSDDLCASLSHSRTQQAVWAKDLIVPALQSLQHQESRLIPTRIPEIDDILNGGLRTKELVVVGALPSRGKSSLLRQLEIGALRSGSPVLTHTIEVPKEEWLLHHAAAVADIPAWKMRRSEYISVEENDRLRSAAVKIEQWPLLLDDEGDVDIDSLISKSRMCVLNHKIRFVGVDYLQLVAGKGDNRREQIGYIAKKLKAFAKKNDCCVVLLSQLSRKGDINSRPTMQDLKESGDIEAAADVILLNYRPVHRDTEKFTGEDEIICAKQRNGSIGTMMMRYNSDSLRFESR